MEKIICEQRKNRNGNVPNALAWLHILVTFHTHYMCRSDNFNVEVLNVWNESSLLIHLEPILWCECECILLWLSHRLPNDDDNFSFKSICQCIMEPYEWCTQPKTYTVCKISMLKIDVAKRSLMWVWWWWWILFLVCRSQLTNLQNVMRSCFNSSTHNGANISWYFLC